MTVHFVGFKGDEYTRAVAVFGQPDFIHRQWDRRAVQEAQPGDTVVFAGKERPDKVREYTFDDSAVM